MKTTPRPWAAGADYVGDAGGLVTRVDDAVGAQIAEVFEHADRDLIVRAVNAFAELLAVAHAAGDFFGSDEYGDPAPEDEPMIRALNALWDAHPKWREWTS